MRFDIVLSTIPALDAILDALAAALKVITEKGKSNPHEDKSEQDHVRKV